MSHNTNEIEVEFKFWAKDPAKLETWLDNNAKLQYTKRQIDEYFNPAHKNFFAEEFPHEVFRLRNSDNKYSTTYKNKFFEADSKGTLSHNTEFETEISNGDQFRKILIAIGFVPYVTVDKVRKSFLYKNFEIELDTVKDLGTVCEIEIQGEYSDIVDAKVQIRKLAEELELSEDIGPDLKLGYAIIMARKK